jgi:hypothetical protein
MFHPWNAYSSDPGHNRYTKRCDCDDRPYMAIIDISEGEEHSMVTLGCVLCGKTTGQMPITSAFVHVLSGSNT